MKCPVCENELTPLTIQGVTVDACLDSCGGVWFDNFELNKFLTQDAAATEILRRVQPRAEGFFDYTSRRNCPRCADVVMMRHYASPKRAVELDSCPGCAGCWLDAEELARLRRERATRK
ncbi:MAG TPA: zf-TFIIB domain-containing protein [Verrucomicrobiae bacterium]|jgi:Zn-finger nucleic acid-binding protein